MHKIITLVFGLFLFCNLLTNKVQAQFSVGLHTFENQIHNSDWKRVQDNTGFALELIGKEHLKKFFLNFRFGVHFDYFSMGKVRYTGQDLISTNWQRVEYKLHNHALSGHLFVRVTTKAAKIRLYGDALIGYRSFFTYQYLRTEDLSEPLSVTAPSSIEREEYPLSSQSLYSGLSAGLQYRIFKWLYADLRFTQNFGGKMEYANTSLLNPLGGDFTVKPKSTRFYTQHTTQIGLEIRMGGNDSKCKKISKSKKCKSKTQKLQKEKSRKPYKVKTETPKPKPTPKPAKPSNKTLFEKG